MTNARTLTTGLAALALALTAACGSSAASTTTAAAATASTAAKAPELRLGYFANVTHASDVYGVASGSFAKGASMRKTAADATATASANRLMPGLACNADSTRIADAAASVGRARFAIASEIPGFIVVGGQTASVKLNGSLPRRQAVQFLVAEARAAARLAVERRVQSGRVVPLSQHAVMHDRSTPSRSQSHG